MERSTFAVVTVIGALLLAFILVTVVPINSLLSPTQSIPHNETAGETPTTVNSGGTTETSQQTSYGLLPAWEQVYDGDCADCHMGNGSLHSPPFHPIGGDSGGSSTYFYDDNIQLGPNLQTTNFQESGISISGKTTYCGDCHTAANRAGFANPETSQRTGDPHSVHDNVVKQDGCGRCHNEKQQASLQVECGECHDFNTPEEAPFPVESPHSTHSSVINDQGCNACHQSLINENQFLKSPLNMVRETGQESLATRSEAPYGADGTESGGDMWTKYPHPETADITANSCGDCHGTFHKQNIQFTFDSQSRIGPVVEATGGPGIHLGNNTLECGGSCHSNDVHAVHTNGEMSAKKPSEMDLSNVQGAESCNECHGRNIAEESGGHFTADGSRKLGLRGPNDGDPDAAGYDIVDGDCGFCHSTGSGS